jgi:hypothetical protein
MYRDCEIPKEVLNRGWKKRNRGSVSPKVYIRVKRGKIIEVVGNSTVESESNLSQYRRDTYPQTVLTRERYEICRGDGSLNDVEIEEIIT